MRIEGNRPMGDIGDVEGPKPRATQNKLPVAKTKSDEVRISSAAKEMAAADTARQQKVEALKRSVESGTYRVEPEKVADGIIRSMLRKQESGE